MILQIELTNLIEPDVLTEAFALLIIAILVVFAWLAVQLRHALLSVSWMLTVMVLGMAIVTNLEFIWFWIMVMTNAAIVGLAGVWRFFVIPARSRS